MNDSIGKIESSVCSVYVLQLELTPISCPQPIHLESNYQMTHNVNYSSKSIVFVGFGSGKTPVKIYIMHIAHMSLIKRLFFPEVAFM